MRLQLWLLVSLIVLPSVLGGVYVIDTPSRRIILSGGNGTGGNFVPGSCPGGFAVQNTTLSGVDCVSLAAGSAYYAGEGLILSGNTFSFNDSYANQRWNDTTMINTSWNQTKADGLYYSISNPSGYITGYTETDPFTNRSWNQTKADALYYSISNPSGYISGYVETDPFYNRSWNQSKADGLYYSISNPSGFITGFTESDPFYNRSWNQTKADGLYINYTATVCYANGTNCPIGSSVPNNLNVTSLSINTNVTFNGTGSKTLLYVPSDDARLGWDDSFNEFFFDGSLTIYGNLFQQDLAWLGTYTLLAGMYFSDANGTSIVSQNTSHQNIVRFETSNSAVANITRDGNLSAKAVHLQTDSYIAGSRICTPANALCSGTASGDGTGGWTNTSTSTTANLNVSIAGDMNASGQVYAHGVHVVDLQTYYCDFMSNFGTTTCLPNFLGAAIGTGGTGATSTGNYSMPGTVTLSSGTAANTGYQFTTSLTALRLNKSEQFTMVFGNLRDMHPSNLSVIKFGFIDSVTSTEVTDGVFFTITTNGTNSTMNLRTKNATSFNTSQNVIANYSIMHGNSNWYMARITIIDSNTAYGELYNATPNSNGNLLWNATINNFIPKNPGQETGAGVMHFRVGAGAANPVFDIDSMMMEIEEKRPLRLW